MSSGVTRVTTVRRLRSTSRFDTIMAFLAVTRSRPLPAELFLAPSSSRLVPCRPILPRCLRRRRTTNMDACGVILCESGMHDDADMRSSGHDDGGANHEHELQAPSACRPAPVVVVCWNLGPHGVPHLVNSPARFARNGSCMSDEEAAVFRVSLKIGSKVHCETDRATVRPLTSALPPPAARRHPAPPERRCLRRSPLCCACLIALMPSRRVFAGKHKPMMACCRLVSRR